jgi:MoxR-like ATPase
MVLSFKRLQCTPDLLPADITGVSIFDQEDQIFRFVPGPIFSNILLAAVYRKFGSGYPRTQRTPAGGQSARPHRIDEGLPGLGDDRRQ